MAKQIIYCADGTWNNPSQDENEDQSADPTNVYKLFVCLRGECTVESLRAADEQEKFLVQNGVSLQAAKYIHGVGDSRNTVVKLLGGAFGAGVISRVVRGYTFISRNYEPGDHIHIVGFSRGAYTARALGGLIASQGLLAKRHTADKEHAYEKGAQAWYRYRNSGLAAKPDALAHLTEITARLSAFISRDCITADDLVPVNHIASIAVWDTVGALGFPKFSGDGRRVDAFRFADTQLSAKVSHGYHALALDEQRVDFAPTLWDAADNVTQVLFPGAHSDVGGGYPMSNNESGMSDGALQWMMDRLAGDGVLFHDAPPVPIVPDPSGIAHKPWEKPPFNIPTIFTGRRVFPPGMALDASVQKRLALASVVAAPGEMGGPYQPDNLPA
jgi:uncharacterized protein (DUF2235 family)